MSVEIKSKHSAPLVSVIIPACNAEKYIEQTIGSVQNQTYANIEVIVINDGSTDRTGEIVQNLQKNDPRISCYHQPNSGVSKARNQGFLNSKGSFIAFLDADDVWLPENIEKKVTFFQQNPDAGLVHSDAQVIDGKGNPRESVMIGKEGHILNDLLAWNGTCIPGPSSILLKREVMEKVGMFDETLSTAADREFFFRVTSRYKVGRVPEITWHYRLHAKNMHSNIPLMEKDERLVVKKAKKLGLYRSKMFELKCKSNMYLILAGTWWKNGKNKPRGLYYLFLSLFTYFPNLGKIVRKFM